MCSSVFTNKVLLIIFLDDSSLVFCDFIGLRYSVLYYSELYYVNTLLRILFNEACENSASLDADKSSLLFNIHKLLDWLLVYSYPWDNTIA